MKRFHTTSLVVTLAAIALAGAASLAFAQGMEGGHRFDGSLLGGMQTLNKNDTALPDLFISIPAVATVGYSLTPNLAVEGDFTWMIPVKRSVDVGSGAKQDRRTPDMLAYQAGLRAALPLSTWTPYLAAGAGAVTFLSGTESDRLPQLGQAHTMFALNFGGGTTVALASPWAVRADFREFAAFPSDHTDGLSSNGKADAIWMERTTLGLSYRF